MRSWVFLAFVVVASLAAGGAQSAFGAPIKHMAPADAYFGRMKMSYLGILNNYKDISIKAGAHTTSSDLIHKLRFAEEALEDWAKKHPHDPQVARTYYIASEVYKKIWTKEFQDKAWGTMQLIVKRYPNTFYGKQVSRDTAGGFTQHYYAATVPCSSTSAQPTMAPSISKSQPKVQIETTPCIPPATPAPSASNGLEGPHWVLGKLDDHPLSSEQTALAADMIFDPTTHRVVGSTGCNRFSSPYELHDQVLRLGDVISTRMACAPIAMKQEQELLRVFAAVRIWKIVGNTLMLQDEKEAVLAELFAKPAP